MSNGIIAGVLTALFAAACAARAQEPTPGPGPQRFALVIGITGYPKYPISERLRYADDDARDFAATLTRPECGGFPEHNVFILTNAEATEDAINSRVRNLAHICQEEDIVYFFFAGHGAVYGGRSYLMPYDADRDMPESRGLEVMEFIGRLRSELRYGNLLCFIDACHSGGIEGDPYGTRGTPENLIRGLDSALHNDGRPEELPMAFVSCSVDQSSIEDSAYHGLFTHFLIEAMLGGDERSRTSDSNGIVTAGAVDRYVYEKVSRLSRQRFGAMQEPKVLGLRRDFPIAALRVPDIVVPPQLGDVSLKVLDSAHGLARAGRSALDDGNMDLAAERLSAAVALVPALDTANYNLGIALRALGDRSGAIRAFRSALARSPWYANAHLGLGVTLLDSGAVDEAAIELRIATAYAPDAPDAYRYLATARRLRGELIAAADALDAYARLTPDPASASKARRDAADLRAADGRLHESRLLADAGEFDAAVHELYNVLRTDPVSAIAYREIGVVLYRAGSLGPAEENLRIALRLNPEASDTHYLLAWLYDETGKRADASSEYSEYIRLAPNGRFVRLSRSRIAALDGGS